MIRKLMALLALLALAPGIARPSDLNARIEAQRAKTQAIQARLRAKRSELHTATVRVGDLQQQLAQTNAAIAAVNARLGDLDDLQRSTQHKLWWNGIQLDAARKTLKLHDDLLKSRLVDVYEHGDMGYLAVLLASKSFTDFVERWQDLRLLIAANERAVRERKSAEAKVSAAQNALQATQTALASQQQAQQRAQNRAGLARGRTA